MEDALDARSVLIHQVMLGDGERLRAYDRALKQVVRPGDTVVDVGAGTLVLGLLALRHGAAHVYAIEGDPATAAIGEVIAKSNDLDGRLTLIQGDARAVKLPCKADVIVAELMGNLGPEEEMPEILAAVARKNLAPGGHVVPQNLTTRLTAIQFDDEGWGVWSKDFLGYRLDSMQEFAEPAAQLHFFQHSPKLLSAHATVGDFVLGEATSGITEAPVRLRIDQPGTLHAVMGSFTTTLAAGVTLANFPSYAGCNWGVWIWPLRHTRVAAGDVLLARLRKPARVRMATDWSLDCSISRAEAARS